MESRQAPHQQLRSARAQEQPRDNRFSWQVPTDSGLNQERAGRAQLNLGELTPQQIAAERVRLQDARRAQQEAQQHEGRLRQQSYTPTPVQMRSAAPWEAQRRPSEPTGPQSPASPEDAPGAPTTLMAPHSFSQPIQHITPTATTVSPMSPVPHPSHPYAATTSASLQSPTTTIDDTRSPSFDKPQVHSPGAHDNTAVTSPSTAAPYIPYGDAHNSPKIPYSPGLPSKASPYGPDDLVHVHHAAALEHGRTAPLALQHGHQPFAGVADTRAHQPGQIAHPNQKGSGGRGGAWGHSLLACTPDADTCCLGLVCPCVVHGRTAYRLGRRGGDPTDMLGFGSCNAACGLMAALACVGCVFPMVARTRIRHAYGIEGGVGGDCAAAWCCCCCVAVQNEREVKEREESRRRHAGPGAGEGYVPPSAEMRYQPGGS